MTADKISPLELKSHSSNSLIQQRKPEHREKAQADKMRGSAIKIASIVFCAAHGRKYKMLVGDTPSPERLHSSLKKFG